MVAGLMAGLGLLLGRSASPSTWCGAPLRLLGRPVSESGRLCRGDGTRRGAIPPLAGASVGYPHAAPAGRARDRV